ncbi:hypothetical protein BDW42DRAFT_108971 [Aspergillus taichungensis]|uniref:GXWXG protein-domain-containing protein n=1 Tax=Aspergillus taichungensis TaxID=482145 RepID=A0A2J5I849_9EURO|nr:hypothetical protein BDW42DRAFT_108971 [Aspergillus taichungensis]
MSALDQFLTLTQQQGKINAQELEDIFNRLPPAPLDLLRGPWNGGSFDTGHPIHKRLRSMNWLGKTFHSTEDVDPIVVARDGERVCDEAWGHARLREVKFRGVISAAMVYDLHPIIDHFRLVTPTMVAGAMDTKVGADLGTYYFYLTKESGRL